MKTKAMIQKNKKLVKQFRDMGLAPEEVEELLRIQKAQSEEKIKDEGIRDEYKRILEKHLKEVNKNVVK